MSPRWYKVLRDMRSNKSRTLLVVMSIAVGVFAIGVIASTQIMISADLTLNYASSDPASATLFTSPFDQELIDVARHIDGVAEAEGRRSVGVRVQVGPEEWRDMNLGVIADYDDMRLNRIWPQQGAWPPPDRELLIERASLPLTNAQVGDSVLIETPDGKQRHLRIAGTVHDINKPPAAFEGTPYAYITFDTLEWLGWDRSFDELRIKVAQHELDREHISQMAEVVRKKVEKGGETVGFIWIPVPGKHPADEVVQPVLMILGVLGGLSLFLSGFLVVNTISALLTQQIRQIGVMKAIGARTNQIVVMYLGKVLIFGVLSLFVAVPLGALGAYAFTLYLASLINFDLQGFRIPPEALALEIAVGLGVPLLASFWPILSGTRITVREAVSSYGLGKGQYGAGLVDQLAARVQGLPRPLLLSLRNTFRRKGRLALTLFTLTLGGGIFIAVMSVHASLLRTLDDFFLYWNYDVNVDLSRLYRAELAEREALRVPGVVTVESWGRIRVSRVHDNGNDGRTVSLFGLPVNTQLLTPTILEGRWLLPSDQNALVINSAVLEEDVEPDLKVGDEVILKVDGRESPWKVVGVAQAVLTGPIFYANKAYVEQVSGSLGRTSNLRVVTDQHDLGSQIKMGETLKQHLERAGINVSGTQAVGSIRENLEYQFNLLVVFLTIMAVLLAIVGGLGLMGTMGINVLERTREIGVMRAIGAANSSVLQIFLVEGVLIGLLSWVVGVFISVPISRLLSEAVGVAFIDAPLNYTFSTGGAFIWLVLVLVLAMVSSFLPSWNASRITVRDVLAYE